MYQTLLTLHAITRWFVLITLVASIFKAYIGYTQKKPFSKKDNSLRHWTATVAHIQLILGITLFMKSPIVKYFWSNFSKNIGNIDIAFFGLYHFLLMLTAVILLTIGSALTKRKPTDQEKYKTMLIWFSISLLLIFIAIPWPFSPLANRPLIRPF